MLICNENNKVISVDQIDSIINCNNLNKNYFWIFNLDILEFTLDTAKYIAETTCESILLEINGYMLAFPTYWNILVFDEDTTQLDVAEISDLSTANFTPFIYNWKESKHKLGNVITMDYKPLYKNTYPYLNKNQMLCHPINYHQWIVVSPNDPYKYIKDKLVGDII